MLESIDSPALMTARFALRPVAKEDAADLLACYSDPQAVAKMNADGCSGSFYCSTLAQMEESIRFWQENCRKKAFIRFAVVAKASGRAVGTLEIFGGALSCGLPDGAGVLRVDLAETCAEDAALEELYQLTVLKLIPAYRIPALYVKVSNTPGREELLKKYGFVPAQTFRPGYYGRQRAKSFKPERGLAYCGLACCVCGGNENCPGCRNDGCSGKDWCGPFRCNRGKKSAGCWACKDFPCEDGMLKKNRVRAFAKYIALNGEKKLISALGKNEADGLLYHYPGQLVGDYDLPETEQGVWALLERGADR